MSHTGKTDKSNHLMAAVRCKIKCRVSGIGLVAVGDIIRVGDRTATELVAGGKFETNRPETKTEHVATTATTKQRGKK